MENRKQISAFITPPSLILLIFLLLPLSVMAIYSFRTGEIFKPEDISYSLENYINIFTNASFMRVFGNTIVMAIKVALFSVLFAYPVAYFLAFQAGQRKVALMTLIIIPAWTSYLLRVVSWKVVLGSDGLINTLLKWMNLIEETLPIFLYSQEAVIITLVYVWIPFAALPIFVALDRIDKNLLEAAADLGCAPWESFLRVTFPLSLPGVIASLVYVFIPTLGEYVTPMMVGGASGGTYFGNLIQDQFARGVNWSLGSAMSIVLIITLLLMLFVFIRLFRSMNISG